MKILNSAHELDGPKSQREIDLWESAADACEAYRDSLIKRGWSEEKANKLANEKMRLLTVGEE